MPTIHSVVLSDVNEKMTSCFTDASNNNKYVVFVKLGQRIRAILDVSVPAPAPATAPALTYQLCASVSASVHQDPLESMDMKDVELCAPCDLVAGTRVVKTFEFDLDPQRLAALANEATMPAMRFVSRNMLLRWCVRDSAGGVKSTYTYVRNVFGRQMAEDCPESMDAAIDDARRLRVMAVDVIVPARVECVPISSDELRQFLEKQKQDPKGADMDTA